MNHPIRNGLISTVIGGVGILARGASNLSKGEANAHYTPSSTNNLVGILFSILFWGGILLVIYGLIIKFSSKD
jgi:hypothetical protein